MNIQEDGQSEEKPGGHRHRDPGDARPLVEHRTHPTVHGAENDQSGEERKERQETHAMGPEKQLAGHDDPQVEGRFVGVSNAAKKKQKSQRSDLLMTDAFYR